MIFGFNTELSIGNQVCHIQTEDHGSTHPVIETLAYCRGQIIHRLASDYSDLANSSTFSEEALRSRAEEQHRSVIDALRGGTIIIPPAKSNLPSDFSGGIKVRLRNSNSWLSRGTASFDVEVVRSDDGHPVCDASVEVHLEGARETTQFTAVTDADGLARFRFPMPPMSADSAAMMIRATVRAGGDEVRYALRSKQKSSPTERKP
ncbi:MAG TPA: hypothetical protein VGT03_13455 [Candidatus Acidoferrales bacterium]|nr:hypothetical protein [Candidatus Acidoferrales bacterium]